MRYVKEVTGENQVMFLFAWLVFRGVLATKAASLMTFLWGFFYCPVFTVAGEGQLHASDVRSIKGRVKATCENGGGKCGLVIWSQAEPFHFCTEMAFVV